VPEADVHPTAVVYAGTVLGEGVRVLEYAVVGKQPTLGPRSTASPEPLHATTVGRGTRIQADAYITAYSTLEDDVFIAPCVVTTNDNFMGRTERRKELMKGPTIRRGARIGGGAILLPGIEIGEEAFVGAGAVVTKDVDARTIVYGNPAQPIRNVPEDELLQP
jgi:acetyltransferase-like isoleucine patch superfamily enzyme